jgi:DNA-binding NtrC family response regulator
MNRTTILIAGTNNTTVANNSWNITTAFTAEEAVEKIQQTNFDVVVLTAAVAAEERKLQRILSFQQPDTIVIKSSDEGLVVSAITAALQHNKANRVSYSFVDDGLKNAMLPITIQ